MMIKLEFLFILLIGSTISAHHSKIKRSLFEPWHGPSDSPNYGIGTPWSGDPNPWKSLNIVPDLYQSPPKWSGPKSPPVVITKEVRVPVNKLVPVEVAKYIPYPVEKIVPVAVEKIVRVPVDRIVQVPIDRIVRVPVEVPATPPAMQQIIAMAQAPPMQATPPVTVQPQQAMPSMIPSGLPYSVPILITAQGLSISTSGLIPSASGMNQMPVSSSPTTMTLPIGQLMAPAAMPQLMAQPMAQLMAQPMTPSIPSASPISNNSTVGISLILNGITTPKLPQTINQGLTYVNALPDIATGSIQGNSLGPAIAVSDYGLIESLIGHGGGLRWRRNINDSNENDKKKL